MKLYKLIPFSIALTVFLSIRAEAHHPRPGAARARIGLGIRQGRLTPVEVKLLAREQRQIRQQAYSFKRNDGRIGPRERRLLRMEKKRAGRHIFRLKHNRIRCR